MLNIALRFEIKYKRFADLKGNAIFKI